METIEAGHATPANAHTSFVQMYFMVAGTARVHMGGEHREIAAPAVAFVPLQTAHYVENIGDKPLQYIYVSIWPGKIPVEDGLSWREASKEMIRMYDSRGCPPQRNV